MPNYTVRYDPRPKQVVAVFPCDGCSKHFELQQFAKVATVHCLLGAYQERLCKECVEREQEEKNNG